MSYSEIGALKPRRHKDRITRSKSVICGYVYRSRDTIYSCTWWTEEDREFLRRNSQKSRRWLAKALKRTREAVDCELGRLGLRKKPRSPIPEVVKRELEAFLSLGVTIKQACSGLDLAYNYVCLMRRRHGLTTRRILKRKLKPKISAETGVSNGTSGVRPRNSRARKEGCGLRVADRQEAPRISSNRSSREDDQRSPNQSGTG